MAEVTGTLILRPAVSKGTVTVTTPADTAIENCYKLVNEEICDGLTTCVYLGKGETISFQLSNDYIHNIISITRATLCSYSTDNISGANSSVTSNLIKWSDNSSVASVGGLFDGEAEVCKSHSISLTNYDTFDTIKSLILSNDIGIYFGDVTSTKASPIISQIYLEVECTYTIPDDIDNTMSFYIKQNGVWSLFTGSLYKKTSDIWEKINVSSLNANSLLDIEFATYISPLKYTLSSNFSYYTVSGKGECTDANIIIPEKYRRILVTVIDSYAFLHSTMTSITIPSSVTSIGEKVFSYCDNLESIIIDSNNTVYSSLGNCITDKKNKMIIAGCKNSVIPIDGSATSIGDSAFCDCRSLTSITIPDTITSIGEYAFHNCERLTSITIPDSITSIGKGAFYNCESLTSITIPDNITRIAKDLFCSCTKLTTVTFGANSQLTSIGGGAFFNCESLTSITLPASITSIGTSAVSHCYNLTNVSYLGTIAQWEKVSCPTAGWSDIATSVIHCVDGDVII